MRRHQQRFRVLLIFIFFETQQRKFLNFEFNRLQKLSRFLIFILVLTPTNSVEISKNKHFVSRCTIKFNELFGDFITLFDTDVIVENLMDKKYAQQQGIFSNFLIRLIPLQDFDGNIIGSGPVIHFVYIFFVPFGHILQFTRFFFINSPNSL